ncbi:hypothetical protein GCM10025868_10450 [Angustibacter aerolatus]|uniref:Uncharacterized protein n=1 Tax=Angustibacter aerolatus TaxID=1162965 RepID=A0ABQ6JG42_9ACTN|nr:hypothetical protein GCM10025868_10450 [Angustibacter aerolatus]
MRAADLPAQAAAGSPTDGGTAIGTPTPRVVDGFVYAVSAEGTTVRVDEQTPQGPVRDLVSTLEQATAAPAPTP